MDAILLAAGNSVRFGKNKLLYQLNEKMMYQYILELLYEQKERRMLDRVIVVSQYDEIFSDVCSHFPGVEMVRNHAPERGISGSIRLGLECLEQTAVTERRQRNGREPERSEACLFTVADQPFLSIESLVKLEQCWQESDCGIVAAANGDRIGNPVIFSEKYYEELRSLSGDTGGKEVLRRHMDDVKFCEIPVRELEDLDTREAVRIILQEPKEPGGFGQETEQEPEKLLENGFSFLSEPGHVISIVGGGGKTTLLYTLANDYAGKGYRVVVATTTHIRKPSDYPVAANRPELEKLLEEYPIVVAGADAPGEKLKMAEEMTVSDYMELADVVLIEADGAKCLPCKVPIEKEPVILPECDIVIGVMGMDTLGRPLGEICFRKDRAMKLLDTDEQHCMTGDDMAKILSSDWGTRKNVGDREYYVVLNKCDDEYRLRQGERIRALLAKAGITKSVCVSLKDEME